MEEIIGQNLWDLCIDCQVLAAACIMELAAEVLVGPGDNLRVAALLMRETGML